MTDRNEAMKALTQALEMERRGRQFYTQASQETFNEKGRTMFASLADEEEKHVAMVERQMRAIQEEGQYETLPDIEAPDVDLDKELFPPARETRKAELGEDPNVLDALHFALDLEMRLHTVYTNAAKETEDEAGRTMYMWLADAEMTHFDLLMANYESQVDMGGWV